MSDDLRPLSPLNDNYDPPQPWVCTIRTDHDCEGPVVGAIGANPTCANGYPVEVEARRKDRARIEALMDTPEMQAEFRREQAWEGRVS